MGKRKAEARQCSEIERDLLYRSWLPKLQRKLSKMREQSWKDLWQPSCLGKEIIHMTSRKWLQNRKLHLERFQRQLVVVWWNLMSPQGNECNLLYPRNMKIALRLKCLLRWPISIWFTNLFLCLQCRFPLQKLQWTRSGRKSRQSQHGNWRKSKARMRLFSKHKETNGKSTSLHWWTFLTSRTRSWNPNCGNAKAESCSVMTL